MKIKRFYREKGHSHTSLFIDSRIPLKLSLFLLFFYLIYYLKFYFIRKGFKIKLEFHTPLIVGRVTIYTRVRIHSYLAIFL
jgi:hypothetical protein